jgi:hypothetical protein
LKSIFKHIRPYVGICIYYFSIELLLIVSILVLNPLARPAFAAKPFVLLELILIMTTTFIFSQICMVYFIKWRRKRTEEYLRLCLSNGDEGIPVKIEKSEKVSIFRLNGFPVQRRAFDEKGNLYFFSNYPEYISDSFDATLYVLPRRIPFIDFYAIVTVRK